MRMPRAPRVAARRLPMLLAVVLAGLLTTALSTSPSRAQRAPDVARGRAVYLSGCSACHGMDARGIRGRGPTLVGVGAQAADFYVRTGRMPLADPKAYPVRATSLYSRADREAVIAYVASLGGPSIPVVDAASGSVSHGKALFTEHCAGCHQIDGQGGVVTPDVIAPSLEHDVQPVEVAEAIRIGPYVMPRFTEQQLSRADVDDLARYVQHVQDLPNDGGWGLGNIGPIPEGMAIWGFGICLLVLVARIIGERTPG